MLVGTPRKGPFVFKPGGIPAKKSEYESFTSISKFLECPVLYHDYYAKKFRESISKELLFGRAWHGTVEDALVEKRLNGLNMHPTALQDRFEMRLLMEMSLNRNEFEWKGTPSPEDYVATGRNLIKQWREQYLPALQPSDIETDFWIVLSGCKRALYGKLDLVTTDGLLIDHKTSSKTWAQIKSSRYHKQGELDLQMAMYHGGYQHKYKTWPKACELHRAVLSDKPEIERIDVSYTVEEVQEQFNTRVKPAVKAIEKGWATGEFLCTCGNHTTTPATAPRPLAIEGWAAGTTEGPVVPTETLLDKVNQKAKRVRTEPSQFSHPPLAPSVVDEVPF